MNREVSQLRDTVANIARRIFKTLGPAFEENVYEAAIALELSRSGIAYQSSVRDLLYALQERTAFLTADSARGREASEAFEAEGQDVADSAAVRAFTREHAPELSAALDGMEQLVRESEGTVVIVRSNSRRRSEVQKRAKRALQDALKASSREVDLDEKGYTDSVSDNLIPSVAAADFEEDLRQGSGDELNRKIRAAHSSTALAVNCFAPFQRNLSHLHLCGTQGFTSLHFEKKCPTGLQGTPPNLDVLASRSDRVVAIESKCTEYLSPTAARFRPSYRSKILDDRRSSSWYREMARLWKEPEFYRCLDAAQLIKHAFGLMRCYPDRRLTLLYIYWEPLNEVDYPIFEEHRREIVAFADRISGSLLDFEASTYRDLWSSWHEPAPQWLRSHLKNLKVRYAISI